LPFAPVILDPTQPTDRTVVQHRSSTLIVVADASPPISYQWFHDDNPISGATSNSYTIADMTLLDAGKYFCQVSNPVGMTNSRTATIGYNEDTNAPVLIRAIGSGTFDKVVVE